MRLVEIAMASVKTTVGATRSNVERALSVIQGAAGHATVIALQEQLLGGYPPEDLVQWRGFVDDQARALRGLVAATAQSGSVVCVGMVVARGDHVYNCAVVLHRGRLLGVVPKEKLPTYNVFYEQRTFARGAPGLYDEVLGGVPFGDLVFELDFGTLAVEVCEDIWSPDGPMRRRCYSGAELVLNLSASPFRLGVVGTRREMLATRSADNQCTLVYANAVGAQDALVFDGGALVFQNGRGMFAGPRFSEGVWTTVVDLDRTRRLRNENTTWRTDAERFAETPLSERPRRVRAQGATPSRSGLRFPVPPGRPPSFFLPEPAPPADPQGTFCEELLDALALGVGDYFEKNGFAYIGIALSGGRDSLLVLLIAARYAERAGRLPGALIRAFYMPTRFSSSETRLAAETICQELGVPIAVVSIEEAFERETEAARAMLQPGEQLTPITLQNIQARLRAQRMWNWSNATGGLFLQTGNMSEKAVGYTTVGGDLMGALAVIANLPKTVVIYLLEYLRAKHGYRGIDAVFARPAGPELAANQEGEKELMPFAVLDACFYLYAGEKLSPHELVEALQSLFAERSREELDGWVKKFVRLFSQSIYKWVQSPLSLHVGNLDLDRERALQLPVVESREWMES